MSPSVASYTGTQSSRAQQLANAQFGPTQLVPILLEGSEAELNRRGPALVRALDMRAHTRVLSAWDGGAVTASSQEPHGGDAGGVGGSQRGRRGQV